MHPNFRCQHGVGFDEAVSVSEGQISCTEPSVVTHTTSCTVCIRSATTNPWSNSSTAVVSIEKTNVSRHGTAGTCQPNCQSIKAPTHGMGQPRKRTYRGAYIKVLCTAVASCFAKNSALCTLCFTTSDRNNTFRIVN